jgi:GT2 family glycosyltransferase
LSIIKVSFIVPLYNHVDYSKAMINSLIVSLSPDLSYEIIFIDDASVDSTKEWLNSFFHTNHTNVKRIFNSRNLGYAKSNNRAVSHAEGIYLALINNDLLFSDGWLEPMLEILKNESLNAGVVGNVQYKINDQSLDHAGIELDLSGQFKHIKNFPSNQVYAKCFAVTGACLLIRKDDFVNLGGFDEDYINGGEDVDLCFSLNRLGKNTYVSFEGKIGHHVSLSRDRSSIQNEINSRRVQSKWRNVLKSELSKKWSNVLLNNDREQFKTYIDGDLTEGFMASPHSASRVLAEHFLSREESRWKTLIDGVDLNHDLVKKCSAKGIRYIENHQCYLVDTEFQFHVKNLDSAINFFVCGKRVDAKLNENLAIVINVNDIQIKLIELAQRPNINVGIINPIFLSGMDNRFKISCYFIDPSSKALLGDASKSIAVTHFVLNDMEIHRI